VEDRRGRATVIGDERPTSCHWETGKAGREKDPKARKHWGPR